jgi:glycosyltransferase involved in cell wall biosynthesis
MVDVFSQHPEVDSITVFAQEGARLPATVTGRRITVDPCWGPDHTASLIGAFFHILKRRTAFSALLFNIFPSAFGRSRWANAVGLLLPTALAVTLRRPTVVYMHNLLETQDIEALGYQPTRLQKRAAHILESLLLRWATVIVPLPSQEQCVTRHFSRSPKCVFVPVEPMGLLASGSSPREQPRIELDGDARVLMLGMWGPQKDLNCALEGLRLAQSNGLRFSTTITGMVNSSFPEFRQLLNQSVWNAKLEGLRMLGEVPDSSLLQLLYDHDVLVLPYRATGGYSGALTLGAFAGMEIFASDLPQLKETADAIGADVAYFRTGNSVDFAAQLKAVLSRARIDRARRLEATRSRIEFLVKAGVDEIQLALSALA